MCVRVIVWVCAAIGCDALTKHAQLMRTHRNEKYENVCEKWSLKYDDDILVAYTFHFEVKLVFKCSNVVEWINDKSEHVIRLTGQFWILNEPNEERQQSSQPTCMSTIEEKRAALSAWKEEKKIYFR